VAKILKAITVRVVTLIMAGLTVSYITINQIAPQKGQKKSDARQQSKPGVKAMEPARPLAYGKFREKKVDE